LNVALIVADDTNAPALGEFVDMVAADEPAAALTDDPAFFAN